MLRRREHLFPKLVWSSVVLALLMLLCDLLANYRRAHP